MTTEEEASMSAKSRVRHLAHVGALGAGTAGAAASGQAASDKLTAAIFRDLTALNLRRST